MSAFRIGYVLAVSACASLAAPGARAQESAPPAESVPAASSSADAPPTSNDAKLPRTSDQAEEHFRRAVELMKADRCNDAVPEFLESQALDPSAATLVNLGTCYVRLGRKATAWKTYRRAAETAIAERNDALHERATQAMKILGPTLTKLQIVAPRQSAPLSIRVNGEVIPDYVGLPIPLDPGENIVEAAAPGHEPWQRRVEANGELGATIVVQVPELAPIPQALPLVAPPPPATDLRLPAALVGGAGIAALLTGGILGLSANSTYHDADPHCAGNACTAAGINLRDDARDRATAATVSFSVGLVAAAAGVALWIASPRASHTRASVAPRPLFDPFARSAGIEIAR